MATLPVREIQGPNLKSPGLDVTQALTAEATLKAGNLEGAVQTTPEQIVRHFSDEKLGSVC